MKKSIHFIIFSGRRPSETTKKGFMTKLVDIVRTIFSELGDDISIKFVFCRDSFLDSLNLAKNFLEEGSAFMLKLNLQEIDFVKLIVL